MHSSLILILVVTEIFPAPPVLLYAYYSRLNFAMLGVDSLKFCVGRVQIFCKKFCQVCVKMLRAAL